MYQERSRLISLEQQFARCNNPEWGKCIPSKNAIESGHIKGSMLFLIFRRTEGLSQQPFDTECKAAEDPIRGSRLAALDSSTGPMCGEMGYGVSAAIFNGQSGTQLIFKYW